MSETDIGVLHRQLQEINIKLERMDQKFEAYPDLVRKVEEMEKAIAAQTQRCNFVQDSKTKINWGGVFSSVISALTGAALIWFISSNI